MEVQLLSGTGRVKKETKQKGQKADDLTKKN